MTAKAEQKARTHGSILESAGRLLRRHGIAGASVANVMQGAGLTVGGFYAHFASKEQLIDDAFRRAQTATRAVLLAKLDDKPPADRIDTVLKRYLSAAHRDAPDDGCALPAVVGDVCTTGEHRGVVAEQLGALTDELEAHMPKGAAISRRHLALGLAALMYGGLSLARAVRGTELSDEILRACRALGRLAAR